MTQLKLKTLLFSFLFFCLALIIPACSGKKTENKKSVVSDSIAISDENRMFMEDVWKEKGIDIPIAINLGHSNDEEYEYLGVAEYRITKETDAEIFIDTNSSYYKKYMSGKRFKTDKLHIVENSENVEFLTLELDIVNNTDRKLSINELNLLVSESRLDSIPQIYICTSDDTGNCINFINQSWFNWKGFTFYYTILRKGESFNGEYKNKKYIPYFKDYQSIDLLPDLKEMGYDFDGLVKAIRKRSGYDPRSTAKYEFFRSKNDEFAFLCFAMEKDDPDFKFFNNKFAPFQLVKRHDFTDEYSGQATLYGSIKFDNSTKTVDFIADISLSTPCDFGGLSYENDMFNVKLKSTGENYILRYPYSTVIEPRGSEFVKLIVVADKSSLHKFTVDLVNDNGLVIRSKKINFHHYQPKN